MKGVAVALLFICTLSLAFPVLAGNDQKYGYVTVENVDITLEKGVANIDIRYSLDEPTRLIVFLLGKQDLKNRILKVLNYDDAEVVTIEMDRANLVVKDVSYNYGRGIYWFPSHQFNVIIPTLKVTTPQITREFFSTNTIPNGIGYFDNP
ncbi:MAG: hypothetical protein A4E38_00557 [Methanoregulaceae archaeon PtaB.Bin108]|nr:MAG: hypothetical protein A4E38_00557 [Methanoregulaceae archaeon PtaB.Bin108]